MPLIAKLKKARETLVSVSGFNFTIRRPTDLEVLNLRGAELKQGDIMSRFVVDWGEMKEIDIIPGGNPVPVPFDSDLFMAWAADRPDLWGPLTDAILTAYADHQAQVAESLGKSSTG
jgi:hypothetical protein